MRVNLDNVVDENEESFAQLLDASEKVSSQGALQVGKIIKITDESVIVALPNSKFESYMPLDEIKDSQGGLLFKEGDSIEVSVMRNGGRTSISYKRALRSKKVVEKIKELGENYKDKIIEAKVLHKNKGGYVMDYEGVDVFLPRRDCAFKEGAKVEGKTYKVAITNVDSQSNSIIVSRKRFFDLDKDNRKVVVTKLLEGERIYDGEVKKITPFGVFVEIEGVEGLIHYTEISHRGPVNPDKFFKVGDKIKVKVINYDEEKRRLALSYKALSEDPWKEVEKELEVGYTIKVVVSNIEEYGAFVDLGNEIEGFLHISEISWDKNIKHPSEHLKLNQELDVEIIEIDSKNRRLRVSLKKLLRKPFAGFLQEHKEGDVLKGKIVTLTDFGAFVNLGAVDGLLHNEDAFWERGLKCKDNFKVGDEVEVKIIKIDSKNERISLSKKALDDSPAKDFGQKYKVNDIVEGPITEIKDFGVFIDVDGVEVLIKNEDIPNAQKETLKIGDALKCVLYSIDVYANRIRASVRNLQRQLEREDLRAFEASQSEERMTLGDKIKNKISDSK
ncbi:30S ribosomal protein S1 [Helicobacter sp. MIT 00-7814]|uniref:30S ribosomal protein S1 n=1 Tax=unclassified Helicobacter TaxID=2593540 RepID=UPI000E1EBFFB|nr:MULTISPECIES: 30S ribosomal protein S1 [unclassified Helicobacter]RDU56367.1 30S ribosomal protein S1 [Helicobacter sp. MIT 99-10781]RDU56450.1 30S ribosomal protein S1 [Helicobacter sp. MIT 00-7814]